MDKKVDSMGVLLYHNIQKIFALASHLFSGVKIPIFQSGG